MPCIQLTRLGGGGSAKNCHVINLSMKGERGQKSPKICLSTWFIEDPEVRVQNVSAKYNIAIK